MKYLIKIRRILVEPRQSFRRVFDAVRERMLVRWVNLGGEWFRQYKGELYPEHLFHKKAMTYVYPLAAKYCTGDGLDIGAGAWPLPGAVPIENASNENAYCLDRFADGSLDYVFSSHCLEHLDHWQEALRLWMRKLKTGGALFLYLPHRDMVMWRPNEVYGRQHKWSPSFDVVSEFLKKCGAESIDGRKEHDEYYSFHVVARKK
ncbi:MAG: methyltransferase domain-containing protein [Candidatus Vogelbacteria bacterium]|nr:methyltransferase domain-containing protein [Candidatus Vogelbacteria bacterium]